MILYDSFTIALRYSVKLPFSQFARLNLLKTFFEKKHFFNKITTRRKMEIRRIGMII